jgi:hypothetical protein
VSRYWYPPVDALSRNEAASVLVPPIVVCFGIASLVLGENWWQWVVSGILGFVGGGLLSRPWSKLVPAGGFKWWQWALVLVAIYAVIVVGKAAVLTVAT